MLVRVQFIFEIFLLFLFSSVTSLATVNGIAAESDATVQSSASNGIEFDVGQETELFDYLTNASRYDLRSQPKTGAPLKITTSTFIYFFGNIEAQLLEFEAHMLIRQTWQDMKLSFGYLSPTIRNLEGEKWFADNIWTPNIFIENEVITNMMSMTRDSIYVRIESNGKIHYHYRIRTKVFCDMYLGRFPHDSQNCSIKLESWSLPVSEIVMEWDKSYPIGRNEFAEPEYSLRFIETKETITSYFSPGNYDSNKGRSFNVAPYFGRDHSFLQSRMPDGNYSTLIIEFIFERKLGHYLLDYYIPSTLLVAMSWVSFWLEPNAVPGRVTLGTATWLSFITLTKSATGDNLPKVSYVKFLDYWFLICTIFIFATLMEFAIVNNIWRTKDKKANMKNMTGMSILKEGLKEVGRTALTTPSVSRRNSQQKEFRERRKSSAANLSVGTATPSTLRRSSVDNPQTLNPNLTVMSFNSYLNNQRRPELPLFNLSQESSEDLNDFENCTDFVITVPERISNGQQNKEKMKSHTSLMNKLRRRKKTPAVQPPELETLESVRSKLENCSLEEHQDFHSMSYEEISIWIDTKSRIFFPIMFLVFNGIYWGFVASGLGGE